MPGRPRKITIYPDGKIWMIKYYDVDDKRRNKSTGQKVESAARLIAKEIELLKLNPQAPVSQKAKDLYFGKEKRKTTFTAKPSTNIAVDLAIFQQEIERLKKENERLLEVETKYHALLNTIEGRMAKSTETAPTVSEALDQYEEHIQHLARYKRNYYNYIYEFFKGHLNTKIYEITATQIHEYLKKTCKTPERWNRQRKQFTKFFNWACGLWVFLDPMKQVQTKKEGEKEDPHFHEQKEIDKLLKKQKDSYHKAMISTLFYSGVSAHEFRGLQCKDYFILNKQKFIRVAPNECRNIKAAKRRRNIPVGQKLQKALDTYLKDHPGGSYLFPPVIHGCKTEYWNEGTLSRYLNKEVFPDGMDCKSTRRTYGSLQLRNGKTFAEVAALMGNSIKMVEQHYARFKSSEIKSDL
jgi:integrase